MNTKTIRPPSWHDLYRCHLILATHDPTDSAYSIETRVRATHRWRRGWDADGMASWAYDCGREIYGNRLIRVERISRCEFQ